MLWVLTSVSHQTFPFCFDSPLQFLQTWMFPLYWGTDWCLHHRPPLPPPLLSLPPPKEPRRKCSCLMSFPQIRHWGPGAYVAGGLAREACHSCWRFGWTPIRLVLPRGVTSRWQFLTCRNVWRGRAVASPVTPVATATKKKRNIDVSILRWTLGYMLQCLVEKSHCMTLSR